VKELAEQVSNEIRGAWRFRQWALLVLWFVCILGWFIVVVFPDQYRATARVQMDTYSALKPLLGNQIVEASVDQHVSFVQQALLGSVQLLKVADTTGLSVEVENEIDQIDLVNDMRDRISIRSTSSSQRNAGDNLYIIEFEHEDRAKAIEVVTVLLRNFINDTLGANRENNEAARAFIDKQIADNERRLREAEDRLADFKKRNADKLPGTEGGYFTRLQDARDKLATARRELRIAVSKRDRLREQVSGESAMIGAAGGAAFDDLPENSLDARIRSYESQLETLLLDYTERHPDVIAIKQTVERLKAEREEELRRLGIEGQNLELAMLDANPVHQAIQISLNETEVEIATLQADIADQEEVVVELQALIDEVPEVEAELARLNRDYEVIYSGYQELVQSRETQELSSRAYSSDDVDFEVIDPPTADFEPVAPNRPRLFLLVAAIGMSLAGGLAFVLSQLNPVFHDVKGLRAIAGIPVLGAIRDATAMRVGLSGRTDVRYFALNLILLAGIFTAAVGIELVGPGIRELVGNML
jgi:polysaccharide chain length determinant protein (PEP-CTERM system associated)